MKEKVFCPFCGRCLGQITSSDEKSIHKVSVKRPRKTAKKTLLLENKCSKCKEIVYISMEFID